MKQSLQLAGPAQLHGRTSVSGGKNCTLALLATSVLNNGRVKVRNAPLVADVDSMTQALASCSISCDVVTDTAKSTTITIDADEPALNGSVGFEESRKMRASALLAAPLLVRTGSCAIPSPGGCQLGPRPLDMHAEVLEEFGACVHHEQAASDGLYACLPSCKSCLQGGRVMLRLQSVGATLTALMAAACAKGESVLMNAACEPEVSAVASLLREAGVHVTGDGSTCIHVQGNAGPLHHDVEVASHSDRIEAGTLLLIGAATHSHIFLDNVSLDAIQPVVRTLKQMGCKIVSHAWANSTLQTVELLPCGSALASSNVCAAPHPGFPTDLQPPLVATLCNASGVSLVRDTVFPQRTAHVPELRRMGAKISALGDGLLSVNAPNALKGAHVHAHDLRAGAALVVAALSAEGVSEISGAEHISRGYEHLPAKLRALSASISDVVTTDMAG